MLVFHVFFQPLVAGKSLGTDSATDTELEHHVRAGLALLNVGSKLIFRFKHSVAHVAQVTSHIFRKRTIVQG